MRIIKHNISFCFRLAAFGVVLGAFVLNDACADVIYQESGGMVVGEGEIFSSRIHKVISGVTNGWFVVPDEAVGAGTNINARGSSFIQCLPDNGSGASPMNPPSVSYQMQIFTPGTYRLYIRREGNNSIPDSTAGSSDSIFMDIVELKDGDRTTGVFGSPPNLIADWYEAAGNVDGDFATVPWNTSCQAETNSAGASGLSADWLIPTQGVYTLRFSQREDGAAVDAFVFQLKTLPAPTDDGPAMSSLVQNRMAFETVADTFVKRDNGSDPLHGADTELIIKNDWQTTGTSGLDRNTYLRFDISGLSALEGMTLTNATLEIDLIDEGIGTNHNIYVAVIAEDAMAETFDEYLLSSSISPPSSNDVWSSTSDEAVDFTKVFGGAPVGSFVIHTNDNSKTMKFDAPGLLEAIRADTDGVLSLVLYRTFDSSAGDSFASKEHATLFPPRIDVIYRPRKYGTVIIVM